MSFPKTEKIWCNGKFIGWDQATIHVLSHVVSYGSAVFEGIRCYETAQGPAIFRLREHMQRLLNSAHIYRMDVPFRWMLSARPVSIWFARTKSAPATSGPSCSAAMAMPAWIPQNCPIDVYLACWEWGKYLGEEALRSGVDVCVSSWNRAAPNTLPQMAKAAANYMNSQLIRMEAKANGYSEGIALDVNGYVSEGSGENIFVVMNGAVHTPPLANSALPGITRDSVLTLCREMEFPSPSRCFPAKCSILPMKFSFPALPPKSRRSARLIASRLAPARAARSPSEFRTNSSQSLAAKSRTATAGFRRSACTSGVCRSLEHHWIFDPSSVIE